MKTPWKNFSVHQKCLVVLYVLCFGWVFIVFILGLKNTLFNYLYGLPMGLLAMLGGIFGIRLSKKWKEVSTSLAKAIIFLSSGVIAWGIGTAVIYPFYNVVYGVAVPNTSVADVAYGACYPFWIIGLCYLLRATGIKPQFQKLTGKVMLFSLAILVSTSSYYLLYIVARGGSMDLSEGLLRIILDTVYHIGDVTLLTLALFLLYCVSFEHDENNKIRPAITIILLGFVVNYIVGFTYLYTTITGTFFVANWVDFLFATDMFLLSLGITRLGVNRYKTEAKINPVMAVKASNQYDDKSLKLESKKQFI